MSLLTVKTEAEGDKSSPGSIGLEYHDSRQSKITYVAGNDGNKTDQMPNGQFLDIPLQNTFRPSIDSISNTSIFPTEDDIERRAGRTLYSDSGPRFASRSPAPPTTIKVKWQILWARNRGIGLVLLSQLFGALMNVTTRLLEVDGPHGPRLNAFQILFPRMSITALLCGIYMWWAKVPYAPFGTKEVRGLLVARGLGGFFGVYGLYYSLQYIPMAEAIVITFLAPIVVCWACSFLINEPFTRKEQTAAVISLIGVVMIAHPTSFFSSSPPPPPLANGIPDAIPSTNNTSSATSDFPTVTSSQRLAAVLAALLGVLGTACALTTIRWIGKRAHPLISVSYFAVWCTVVSTLALLFIPSIGFRLPSSIREWSYLLFLGTMGFAMQFLLTAGLQHEKSSRATNMVYTQMLFALASDKLVFDVTPGGWSIVGSGLILGSAVYVAVQSNSKSENGKGEGGSDEEVGLVDGRGEGSEEDDGRGPLRGVQEVQLRTMRV